MPEDNQQLTLWDDFITRTAKCVAEQVDLLDMRKWIMMNPIKNPNEYVFTYAEGLIDTITEQVVDEATDLLMDIIEDEIHIAGEETVEDTEPTSERQEWVSFVVRVAESIADGLDVVDMYDWLHEHPRRSAVEYVSMYTEGTAEELADDITTLTTEIMMEGIRQLTMEDK